MNNYSVIKKLVDNRFGYFFLLSFFPYCFRRDEKMGKNNQFVVHLLQRYYSPSTVVYIFQITYFSIYKQYYHIKIAKGITIYVYLIQCWGASTFFISSLKKVPATGSWEPFLKFFLMVPALFR